MWVRNETREALGNWRVEEMVPEEIPAKMATLRRAIRIIQDRIQNSEYRIYKM